MNFIFSYFKVGSDNFFQYNFFPNICKFGVFRNISLCPIRSYELFLFIICGPPLYFTYLISMHAASQQQPSAQWPSTPLGIALTCRGIPAASRYLGPPETPRNITTSQEMICRDLPPWAISTHLSPSPYSPPYQFTPPKTPRTSQHQCPKCDM